MKKTLNLFASVIFALVCVLLLNTNASAQLLINEIEADPGDQQNDSCQYVELRGTPGSTVAANTYFVAIDSDSNNPGFVHVAVNLGGTVIGSNGLIYVNNTFGVPCPGRTPAAGTTVVNYNSATRIGGGNIFVGSESFAILQTATVFTAGQDADIDDDGVLNFSATFIDGVAVIINPDEQFVYPANSAVIGTPFSDQPDAFVRFPNNNTPFAPAAYYYGEIAATPAESTSFEAPLSPNFPVGALLTPGAPNAPGTTVAPSDNVRADFDGDGRTDLSVFRPGDSSWYAQRSTDGFFARQFGAPTDIPAPADYDGDNKTDTAVWRGTAAGNPNLSYFYIFQSATNTVRFEQFGSQGDVPLSGDYDGDGKDDPAVYRNGATAGAQSFFYYRPSATAGVSFISTQWGTSGDRPVSGNFDGDMKADAAVFRPSTREWLILRSSNASLSVLNWGLESDILAPADYDGDGKDDIAVFRPSNGFWYAVKSSDSGVIFLQFGASGDVPVPGDYDGDGKADQAVYRSGVWYQNRSTTGFAIGNFGNASDKPIPNEYIQ
jgi:FG-GAP repeat